MYLKIVYMYAFACMLVILFSFYILIDDHSYIFFIHFLFPVIVVSLLSPYLSVEEGNGAVEVCVQLNHRPEGTIVSVVLTTQPLSADGM